MRVTLQRRHGEDVTRSIEVGSNLRGLRISGLQFENRDELKKALSPEGLKWLADHALPAFTTKQDQEEV